jgi:hypothetical protein
LSKKFFGTNCYFITITQIVYNILFSLAIKRPIENFHEIFGLKRLQKIIDLFTDERILNGLGCDI